MLVGGERTRALLSQSEREYIAGGVQQGVRADGRTREEWRSVECELDVVPQAAGSARVRLGGTDVLVSIKGDVGRPTLEQPAQGQLICSVDSAAIWTHGTGMASSGGAAGSGGGGGGGGSGGGSSGSGEDRHIFNRNAELTALLRDMLITSGAVDRRILSIVEGKHCWILYLDALVLDYDGNLVDTLAMAARLALARMRLPTVRIEEGGEATEIVLVDENDPTRLIPLTSLPTAITLARIAGGGEFVIDPSAAEEGCCEAALLLAVHVDGQIAMLRKLGAGLLDPGLLPQLIAVAQRAASAFNSHLSLPSDSYTK